MHIPARLMVSAAITALWQIPGVIPALASQGPGTSPGTATGLSQAVFFGAVFVAAGIGLMYRFTHR